MWLQRRGMAWAAAGFRFCGLAAVVVAWWGSWGVVQGGCLDARSLPSAGTAFLDGWPFCAHGLCCREGGLGCGGEPAGSVATIMWQQAGGDLSHR